VLVAGLLMPPPAHAADEPAGPFAIRTNHPLLLMHLGLRPGRADVLPLGTIEVLTEASWSNLLERKRGAGGADFDLDLDLGLGRFVIGSRVAPRDGIDVGLELALVHFGGGFLDEFIAGYHRALGISNGGRDQVADGRFSYRVALPEAAAYEIEPEPLALAGTTIDVRGRLLRGGPRRPGVAVQGALKLPTGSPAAGTDSGRPDLGVWLMTEYRIKRLWLYGTGGLILRGPGGPLQAIAIPVVWTWMAAGELRIARSLSIVVQLSGSSPWYVGLDAIEGRGGVFDLTLGLAGRTGRLRWHLGMTQDPISQTPSVDVTAFLSLAYAIGSP